MNPRHLTLLCVASAALGFAISRQWQATPSTQNTSSDSQNAAALSSASSNHSQTPLARLSVSAEKDGSTPKDSHPISLLEITELVRKESVPPSTAKLHLMEALSKLDAAELESLLSEEAKNPDFFRRMRFEFQFAAKRLSEIAPLRAAQLWLSNTSLRFQSDALLAPWAESDPQAFVTWSISLPPDAQRATANALGTIAKTAPEKFSVIAPLIANSPAAPSAARAAIDTFIAKAGPEKDPSTAIAFAKGLPEGTLRDNALAQLAKWPGLDLHAHPEIANAVNTLPKDEASRLGRDLAKSADALPAGTARDSAFASNFRDQAQKDPSAAAKSIESLAGTADYPAAVRGFIDATATKDPKAAIDWALAIDPATSQQRIISLERAAKALFKQNPDEARTWVESAPITDAEFFILTGRQRSRSN